jgi:hypothetical protein
MSRCELSWCARLLASFSVRGGREMSVPAYVRYGHPISTRALNKYDLTEDEKRELSGFTWIAGRIRVPVDTVSTRLSFPRLRGDS